MRCARVVLLQVNPSAQLTTCADVERPYGSSIIGASTYLLEGFVVGSRWVTPSIEDRGGCARTNPERPERGQNFSSHTTMVSPCLQQ